MPIRSLTVYEMNSPGRLAMRPIKTACFMERCASQPTTPMVGGAWSERVQVRIKVTFVLAGVVQCSRVSSWEIIF